MGDILNWIGNNIWIVSILTLILGAYLNTFLTKNKEVLMKIADKKGQYYASYISALLDFNKSHYQRLLNDVNGDINRNYFYMKNLVILYGSNKVIEKLAICEEKGIDFKTDVGRGIYLDLIEEMKNDISNPKIINNWWQRKFTKKNKSIEYEETLFGNKVSNEKQLESKIDDNQKEQGGLMKHSFKFSELGKINKRKAMEALIIFSVGILGLVLLFILNSSFIGLIFAFLMLYALYLIIIVSKEKRKKEFPKGFLFVLYLLFFSNFATFLMSFINNQTFISISFLFALFTYSYVMGIFIYYFLDALYYWGLKRIFPHERKPEARQIVSIRKLSEYIEIDKQKVYFNINIINYIAYFFFVSYGMVLFIKSIKYEYVEVLGLFSDWVKKQSWINFSSFIGILSLLLAIYTITIPIQRKIIKEARDSHEEIKEI